MDEIESLFRLNEPELTLESSSVDPGGIEVRLLLKDCDGYRLGGLLFSQVKMVCLTTQSETFNSFFCYDQADVPADFDWLKSGVTAGFRLFCFVRSEVEDNESVLPLVGEARQAFVVAGSVALTAVPKGR